MARETNGVSGTAISASRRVGDDGGCDPWGGALPEFNEVAWDLLHRAGWLIRSPTAFCNARGAASDIVVIQSARGIGIRHGATLASGRNSTIASIIKHEYQARHACIHDVLCPHCLMPTPCVCIGQTSVPWLQSGHDRGQRKIDGGLTVLIAEHQSRFFRRSECEVRACPSARKVADQPPRANDGRPRSEW